MKRSYRTAFLVAGSMAVATMTVSRAAAAHRRRRLIRDGHIRPVQHTWNRAGEWVIHTWLALPPEPAYTPPVVLVHGFGASGTYFIPLIERLAFRFAVYAPDLPGHGRSDTPRRSLDMTQLADALIDWMDAKHMERACLVGHSMGTQVVVDAAMRYPDRVDRLVLIGPTLDPAARTAPAVLRRLLRASMRERLSLNLILARDYARMGPRLLRELRSILRDRIEEKLPGVHVPVLLIRGENDSIVPQDWFDEVAHVAGTDHIAVVPGSAHAVNYSAPQELVEVITPFLFESGQDVAARATARPPMLPPGV